MRKNKTYEQQKKYYDEYNDYESLGAIFLYWLECGNETAAQMQETYREGTKECKIHYGRPLPPLRQETILSVR